MGSTVMFSVVLQRNLGSRFEVRSSKLAGDGGPAVSSHVERRTSNFECHQKNANRRVLLVDDHAMVRQGLRMVLEGYAEVEVIGEAWNGEEAVAAVEQLRPDVVLMDINMPKKNGIEATAEIKARYPETIVIGLSVNAEGENADAMKRAGAALLITKEAAVDQLYEAIVKRVMK
jgi:CheY-like chemotaxis protein